jgi:hypothetical protein
MWCPVRRPLWSRLIGVVRHGRFKGAAVLVQCRMNRHEYRAWVGLQADIAGAGVGLKSDLQFDLQSGQRLLADTFFCSIKYVAGKERYETRRSDFSRENPRVIAAEAAPTVREWSLPKRG